MSLRPETKRLLWVCAVVLVIVIALGAFFTWTKFFREEKEVFANEEEHFKYGSLGAEGDRGIPYYLWMVLPRVFPDLMPGPGGYKSFGVVWEEGREIPVGFSKKVVGFARITNNCAVCHTATYRLSEDEVPHVVVAGPGHTNNLQSMLRFLFKAAHDPRFNSDIIMNEIRLVSANNYGNGGLSFIDRQIYRYLLIPFTKKALLQQEKQFTWMERYVTDGKPKPQWGPGRDDAMKMTKYLMTNMSPIIECGTEPVRMNSCSKESAAQANPRVKQMGIERPPMLETLDPYGYVSPPLDGIWLRAPYLHNGSVPTLRDLLNSQNERPQTFHRGYDVFDPVKVGFRERLPRATGPTGGLTQPYILFDTREKGNGNNGHTYGTQLSNQDKEKLLEYLKTL